jgi:hypothetical protein
MRMPPRPVPQYTVVCAWCKERQRYGDTWGPRKTRMNDSQLSHGICPDCFRRELEKTGQ